VISRGRPARRPRKPPRRPRLKKRRKLIQPELLPGKGWVLGLDVSSSAVGWCIFHDDALIKYGKLHPHGADGTHGEKLAEYRKLLCELFETYELDHVVVEVPYRGRNATTYGTLMMYLGTLLATYFEYFTEELPKVQQIQPSQVKDLLGFEQIKVYGERKRRMVELINSLYSLDLKYKAKSKLSDDDVADAIALVHAWRTLQRKRPEDDELCLTN